MSERELSATWLPVTWLPVILFAMSDPLGLLPLALGAGGGYFDGVGANQLVTAGLALRQRSAALVLAMVRRRTAAVLPAGPALLTALAASEGHSMLWINPSSSTWPQVKQQCADGNVGALFTLSAYFKSWPEEAMSLMPVVLLDSTPTQATVRTRNTNTNKETAKEAVIDLGGHFGLSLEGSHNADGSEEECLMIEGQVFSHRQLLHDARAYVSTAMLTPLSRSHLAGSEFGAEQLITRVIAPLLQGGRVTSRPAVTLPVRDQ